MQNLSLASHYRSFIFILHHRSLIQLMTTLYIESSVQNYKRDISTYMHIDVISFVINMDCLSLCKLTHAADIPKCEYRHLFSIKPLADTDVQSLFAFSLTLHEPDSGNITGILPFAVASLRIKIHPITVKAISSTSITTQAKIIPTLNESAHVRWVGDKHVIGSTEFIKEQRAYPVKPNR